MIVRIQQTLGTMPDDPQVVAAVPTSPETKNRVIVCHAADHVLGRINAVSECPEPEEPPGNKELKRENTV